MMTPGNNVMGAVFSGKMLTDLLSALLKKAVQVKVQPADFRTFENTLQSVRGGLLSQAFTGSEKFRSLLLLPDAVLSFFLKLSGETPGRNSELKLLDGMAERFHSELFRAEGVSRPPALLTKAYHGAEKEELLWQVSSCKIFQCSTAGGNFYFFIRQHLSEDPESGIISISYPLEFVLGNCMLPRNANIGKTSVYTVFTKVIKTPAPGDVIPEGSIWYRYTAELENGGFSTYYTVGVGGNIEGYKDFFSQLFGGLVRGAAVFLSSRAKIIRAGGGICPRPETSLLSRTLVLEAEIIFGNRRLVCYIVTSDTFYRLLAEKLLEKWELQYLENVPQQLVCTLLSLNQTLFRKGIYSFYRMGSMEPKQDKTLRVSEFFNLLEHDDRKKLIHNFFAPRGYSAGDLQKHFFYKIQKKGDGKPTAAVDGVFNKDEFTGLLPQALKQEWLRRIEAADSWESLLARNYDTMTAVFEAGASDKLILSYKAIFILTNEFKKSQEEDYQTRIDQFLNSTSYDTYLNDLPRQIGQQVLSAYPSNQFALALLPRTEDLLLFAKFISKNKLRDTEDSIRTYKKALQEERLSLKTIYESMTELKKTLEETAGSEDSGEWV